MKPPSLDDQIVPVTAWLTDESFGYEHWRAAQFSRPKFDKHAALVLFDSEEARDTFVESYKVAIR